MLTSAVRNPVDRVLETLPSDLRQWVRDFCRNQPHAEVVGFRGRQVIVKKRTSSGYALYTVSGDAARPEYREV